MMNQTSEKNSEMVNANSTLVEIYACNAVVKHGTFVKEPQMEVVNDKTSFRKDSEMVIINSILVAIYVSIFRI